MNWNEILYIIKAQRRAHCSNPHRGNSAYDYSALNSGNLGKNLRIFNSWQNTSSAILLLLLLLLLLLSLPLLIIL